jgi:hypothetical protein
MTLWWSRGLRSQQQAAAPKLGVDARGSTREGTRKRYGRGHRKWTAVIEKTGVAKQ